MELNDLIQICSDAHPDGLIALEYWNFTNQRYSEGY